MSLINANGGGVSAPMFTPERLAELVTEARLIAAKRTMKLPTTEHIHAVLQAHDALASGAAETVNIAALQNRALIAMMLSFPPKGTAHFAVNPQAITDIETQQLDLAIERKEKDGRITVRLIRPDTPIQQP